MDPFKERIPESVRNRLLKGYDSRDINRYYIAYVAHLRSTLSKRSVSDLRDEADRYGVHKVWRDGKNKSKKDLIESLILYNIDPDKYLERQEAYGPPSSLGKKPLVKGPRKTTGTRPISRGRGSLGPKNKVIRATPKEEREKRDRMYACLDRYSDLELVRACRRMRIMCLEDDDRGSIIRKLIARGMSHHR